MATKISGPYRIEGNKVVFDNRAAEAKLDVSTRCKRRNSKAVKVVSRGKAAAILSTGKK